MNLANVEVSRSTNEITEPLVVFRRSKLDGFKTKTSFNMGGARQIVTDWEVSKFWVSKMK